MKKTHIRLLAVVLCLLFVILTGCQPTPETPPVVGKNNTPAAQASAAPFVTPPAHWKEDAPITLGELTVTIDADITVPDVEKYPILKISDHVFTNEEANRTISVLAQGNTLYPDQVTRPELEESLIKLKASLVQRKKDGADSETITHTEALIEDVEAQLRNMPENAPVVPIQTGFEKNNKGEEYFAVRADLGRDDKAIIVVLNGSSEPLAYGYASQSSRISLAHYNPRYWPYNSEKNEVLAEDSVPVGLQTTRAQAIAQAEALMDELGIRDMQLAQVRPAFLSSGSTVDEETQCWQLIYVPVIEGIPITPFKDGLANTSTGAVALEEGYNSAFYNPVAFFRIDDEGIAEFGWYGPFEITETLNENASLLSFEDIRTRIMQQLPIIYAAKENITKVHVTGISLGYMRVRIKDTQDGYMLLPVWDVFGYNDQSMNTVYGDTIPKTNPQNFIETLLTINAMDGSVIDRMLGY